MPRGRSERSLLLPASEVGGKVEETAGPRDEETEEPQKAVAPGEPERLRQELAVVHASWLPSTQVSFIFPPLEMLTTCLPGAATRLNEPGTVSTTPGSSGSGARTSIL